jgi:hypothetical protein
MFHDQRSLINFGVLIVVAVATTVFILNKAQAAITEIDAINAGLERANAESGIATRRGNTSDWKTYRNEKYGLEFKYPPEWPNSIEDRNVNAQYASWWPERDRASTSISFGGSDCSTGTATIEVVEHNTEPLDALIARGAPISNLPYSNVEKITVDGTDARKFNTLAEGGSSATYVYVFHRGNLLKFIYGCKTFDEPIPAENISQVQKLLETVKLK